MNVLRGILFLGLVFHKLLWEVLRRRDDESRVQGWTAKRKGRWGIKSIKAMVLMFIIIQTLFLDVFPISDNPMYLKIIGTSIFFLGLVTAVIARVQLGKNWADLEDFQVLPQQSLVTRGIYRYIRHPIYVGDVFLLIGLELALNSWLVLGIIFLLPIVVRQALAEEAVLSQALPDYNNYCLKTKRFIPFVV